MRSILFFIFIITSSACFAETPTVNSALQSVLPSNARELTSMTDFFAAGELCYNGQLTEVTYISTGQAALFWSNDLRKNCILSKLDLVDVTPGKEGSSCVLTPDLYQQVFTPWIKDGIKNFDYDKKINQMLIPAKRAIYHCLSQTAISTKDIAAILKATSQ